MKLPEGILFVTVGVLLPLRIGAPDRVGFLEIFLLDRGKELVHRALFWPEAVPVSDGAEDEDYHHGNNDEPYAPPRAGFGLRVRRLGFEQGVGAHVV